MGICGWKLRHHAADWGRYLDVVTYPSEEGCSVGVHLIFNGVSVGVHSIFNGVTLKVDFLLCIGLIRVDFLFHFFHSMKRFILQQPLIRRALHFHLATFQSFCSF